MTNQYDLLGLMDTYKAMKNEGVDGVPSSFPEFLAGLRKTNNNNDGTLYPRRRP